MLKWIVRSYMLLRRVLLISLAVALSSCAEVKITVNRVVPDEKAQKIAYDRAVKFYTQEDYVDAKKSWEEAVRNGPNTDLGKKSQEYLQKVNQILKTLNEINKQ